MSKTKLMAFVAVLAALSLSSTALADNKLNGRYSAEHVKSRCDEVGGDFIGPTTKGSYGCVNNKNGAMVMCDKNQECFGFDATKKAKETRKIVRIFNLNACLKAS